MADQNDQLLEALSHAIMGTLQQPQPTAPVAPSPVGLSPLNAAAGAMNPQAIPYLLQRANAPAQNAYEAQKAAFEGAMTGRQHALTAGVGLAGTMDRGQNTDLLNQIRQGQLDEKIRADKQAEWDRQHPVAKPVTPGAADEPNWQVVYNSKGQAMQVNPKTGQTRMIQEPGGGTVSKPPTTAEEQAVRSGAVLKLRVQQARTMIESGGDRMDRTMQRLAAHDPTGLASGSDFAANATTYQSFINEIGSLTRSLYGAQGIRSYEEILRLINAMPPWNAGNDRIKKQFDALSHAIDEADNELKRVRPDLYGNSGSVNQVPGQKTAAQLADEMGF